VYLLAGLTENGFFKSCKAGPIDFSPSDRPISTLGIDQKIQLASFTSMLNSSTPTPLNRQLVNLAKFILLKITIVMKIWECQEIIAENPTIQ
jgi:hypothetical protein